MQAIVKTIVVAIALYTGLFLACPKQTKQAANTIYSATYAQLVNVGR